MKTCTIDGCDRKHDAKGLCRTHYRASRPRRPDTKVELPCDGCGTLVLKEKRTRRYATVQCDSWACRTWLTFGVGWSEKLPPDHWALNYGATCTWKPPAIARTYECAWCGAEASSTRGDAKYCSKPCQKKQGKVTRRGREFNAVGTYSWADITRLWLSFDKACAYCAASTPLTDIQAEHVIALSRGGANNLTNLLPSCGPCNSDKRELTLDAWARDRVRRGLPQVSTEWHAGDVRYKHLSLLPTLPAVA